MLALARGRLTPPQNSIGPPQLADPRAQQHRRGLAGAAGPVVNERPQRMNAELALNVGAVDSFSECAVTRVASTSMTYGRSASIQ